MRQEKYIWKRPAHTSVAYICLHYWHISANDAEPDQTSPSGAAQHEPTTLDRNSKENTDDAKGRRL